MNRNPKVVDDWLTTLERMRLNIEQTLANNPEPAGIGPAAEGPSAPANLRQLNDHLTALETCLQGAGEEIKTTEVIIQGDVAALNEWIGKMAKKGENLAKTASSAV